MHRQLILLLSIIFLSFVSGYTQVKGVGVPYIKNYSIDDYSPKDFRASPQNWEIFQDDSGMMLFGNTDGLLTFDGAQWRFMALPNHSVLRSIGADSNNIYLGGENEFGFLKVESNGKYKYHSLLPLIPDSIQEIRNIWSIDNIGDTIVFRSRNKLFFYFDSLFVNIIKTEFQFFHHFKHKGDFYVFEAGKGLTKLDDGRLKLVPDGDYYKNYTAWAVFPIGKDSLIFASPIDGLSVYHNNKFSEWNIPASSLLRDHRIYCGTQLNDGNFAFGTQGAGVMVMNRKGEVLQIFNKQNGLQNNVILDMTLDNSGDLWLATSNGISYLKLNSPFTYYTSDFGIPRQNYYINKYGNNLFFSSDEGVYVKSFQDVLDNLEVSKAKLIDGTEGQSWLFQRAGQYLLCGHNAGVLVFKGDKLYKTLDIPVNVWEVLPDPEDPGIFYAMSIRGIYFIKLEDDDIKLDHHIPGYSGNVVYAEFDNNGHLWVSDEVSGVKRLKMSESRDSIIEVKKYTEEQGLPSTEGNWILKVDGEIVLTNPSFKGFYHYNKNIDFFEPHSKINERFRVNDEITLYLKGPKGKYWLRDNGLVRLFEKQGGSFTELETPFKKFKGRNLERVSFLDSTIAFFGTDEYVLNYYINEEHHFEQPFNCLIRKITSLKNDSVLFYGNKKFTKYADSNGDSVVLTLPYELNALRFEYSATYYEEPENTKFMVWLEGLEDKSDVWSNEINKEYTNLHEGEYVFHVVAKNIHGKKSVLSSFPFIVEPPWYRTVYAYILYALIFLLLLYVGIRLYVRKLKADKDQLEKVVKQRTAEIQQQKEEITTQAEELERINQELQKLSLVASKTENAVIIADSKGEVEWINEGFIRLFGYTLSDLKERMEGKLEKLGVESGWRDVFNRVKKEKKSLIYESEIKTKDGKSLNLQTTLTPILDNRNNIQKYIAISTDISRLKQTQEELHKLVATKDKFFSIIAHDLKNPFHSLMGISELLIRNQDSYGKDKLKELYKHLYKVTHQGYQLLTNLLEWSRSQTGNISFNPQQFKVYDLVDESLELVESTAKSKKVEIKNNVDLDLRVEADKNTIMTVIRNLLSNAVKYSEEGGVVCIESEELEEFVKVSVIDYGVGLTKENQDKLFRIDLNYSTRGTKEETGTGLGLILCKEFVEKNGGEISVESKPGKGSVFSFTLRKL